MKEIKSERLNQMQKQLDALASVAEASDAQLVEVINAQASHLQQLTQLVISMHTKLAALFPEYAKIDTTSLTKPPNLIVLK